MTQIMVQSVKNVEKYKDNFFSKIIAGHNNCWQWIGSKSPKGYGFYQADKVMRSHKYSYILFKGKIPKNKVIDHICRNTSCVNPEHLRAVTWRENLLCGKTLAAENKNKTHCIKGHEFTTKNTKEYLSRGNLARSCKKCQTLKTAKYRQEARFLANLVIGCYNYVK